MRKLLFGKEKKNAQKDFYFVMHIPKTGGTTLRHMIYHSTVVNDIYPSIVDLKRNKGKYTPIAKLEESFDDIISDNNCQILMGHYALPKVRKIINRPFKTITILRDPIRRSISHLRHIQNNDPEFKKASISDVFDRYLGRVTNLQARYFGYHHREKNIDEVLKELESVDYIGISSGIPELSYLLNDSLGWDMKRIAKKNVQLNRNTKGELSSKQLHLLTQRNSVDILLYHQAINIIEKRKTSQ